MQDQKPSKFIYLAAPYTHSDPVIRNSRAELANWAAAELMQAGLEVFSPITHGHAIANHLPPSVAHDHDFWMRQCLPMVERADALVILPLSGWNTSSGIAREIAHAGQHGTKVFLWDKADHTGFDPLPVLNYLKGDF